jgi:hypothetical protein
MKVSPNDPFEIVYAIYQHEYLGFLFESFVVKLDSAGRYSLLHQNISYRNAMEFDRGLDANDYELIKLIDSIQQESIIKNFYRKKIKPDEFFLKIYHPKKGNQTLQDEIENHLETKRAHILRLMIGKKLFAMGKDGNPTAERIQVLNEEATILFHFRRNEDNTHYFPTIKHGGEKVDFQYKNAMLICHNPAWLLLEGKLYHFHRHVDGAKLKPFLKKRFIVIPKKVEETYYRKFISPLIAQFDVFAKGFEIIPEKPPVKAILYFSELADTGVYESDLFGHPLNGNGHSSLGKILFELRFCYGEHCFSASSLSRVNVAMEHTGNEYFFYKIYRNSRIEKEILNRLEQSGLTLKGGKLSTERPWAFDWIGQNQDWLKEQEIDIKQNQKNGRKFFIGKSIIDLSIRENIDWFDIEAVVRFGEFEIPFKRIRKYILQKKTEFVLPNGEIAVIPSQWFAEYAELFAFMDPVEDGEGFKLKEYHHALVKELEEGRLAHVQAGRKLEKLRSFEKIDDHPVPTSFHGKLRPYQKAGFNWLLFLQKYNFGGCLADDMGLGKTIQTLALLLAEKEKGEQKSASMLVMPTSLIYNWLMEAQKFTPKLKILNYIGSGRKKDVKHFSNYDLVITSYGITRLDVGILENYYFNYIILDESQAIKNPDSNIAKAVKRLHSRIRLILTGTPIENSTLDLWSQMTFINPGLLGNQKFFRDEFLVPIEKKKDEAKIRKLNTIIKPFILRREKKQVATELPEKVENIHYVPMTAMQEDYYNEIKSSFRNKILESIETKGINHSSLILLRGLSQLRQIANHPRLVDPAYAGDSGKVDDVNHMLISALGKDHNILVFSQFVRYLNIMEESLRSKGIEYAYLDGSTRDRKKQVVRFQDNAHVRVFLISLKAGGVGLNLTKADYVFILDPWWNPAVESQAIDRAHRIGQRNTVFSYKFITKDTVEEKILALQQRKRMLAQEFITTERSFMKNLSKEDIAQLFT